MLNYFYRSISPAISYQLAIVFRSIFFILLALLWVRLDLDLGTIGKIEFLFLLGVSATSFIVNGTIQHFLSKEELSPTHLFSNLFFVSFFLAILLMSLSYLKPDWLLSNGFILYSSTLLLSSGIEPILLKNKEIKVQITQALMYYSILILAGIGLLFISIDWQYIFVFWGGVTVIRILWFLNFIKIRALQFYSVGIFSFLGYSFFATATQLIDQTLVKIWYLDEITFFAIFRYGAREIPLLSILSSSFSNSKIPFVEANSSFYATFRKKSIWILLLLFSISFVSISTSNVWFTFLFGNLFKDAIVLVDIFALLTISRTLFPQVFALGLGYEKQVFKISIIEFLLNLLLSVLFINWWGLEGVAIATIIAFLFEKIAIFYLIYKKERIKVNQISFIYLHVLLSILLVAFILVKYQVL